MALVALERNLLGNDSPISFKCPYLSGNPHLNPSSYAPGLIKNSKNSKYCTKSEIFVQWTWTCVHPGSNILVRNDMLCGLCKNNKNLCYLEHLDLLFITLRFVFLYRPPHVSFLRKFGHALITHVHVHCRIFLDFYDFVCYLFRIFYWTRSIWAPEQKNHPPPPLLIALFPS
jgi:hypothetical protein